VKRSGPIKRKKALKRSTTLRKVNPEAKAKRVKKQKAFYSSAAWKKLRKDALERAGDQCEYVHSIREVLFVENILQRPWEGRCVERTGLQVHHKTNARFGGKERLEDLQVLCKDHHELVEMRDHPTRHPR
jgi:5-methylcytosine-specific restriction endonuclease McrA